MALRDLRPAMLCALHSGLFNQAPGKITRRVFEHRTRALLRRLRLLPVQLIGLDALLELFRTLTVQAHPQLHNDLRRFDKLTRRHNGIALRIELNRTPRAKTAVPVAQVYVLARISPPLWRAEAVIFAFAPASIKHLNPLQHRSQVAVMRARV